MAKRLNIICWEGYEQQAFTRKFAESHHVEIRAQTLLSDFDTAAHLAKEGVEDWHVLNINNAYIKNYLYSRGLIKNLDPDRFSPYFENLLPSYERFVQWAKAADDYIGVCQRFGPFNLVVNTQRISRETAEDEGFSLVDDGANENRFGILTYEDFNLFHVCIGSNISPFDSLTANQEQDFLTTARRWCNAARLISDDHVALNRALIDGEIDFYLSGGVYTASPARRSGHLNVCAITPRHGPIGGLGAIAFAEITSVLDHKIANPLAEQFLECILQPKNAASIAFSDTTCNPVAQMGDPHVFNQLSKEQLAIIQWDQLEEDLTYCADYDLMPNHDNLLRLWRHALETCDAKRI